MHARFQRDLLALAIIAGSLALWTVVPIAWLYLTSGLAPGARFVLVIFGLPLTMGLTFMLLSSIDARRRQVGASEDEGSSLLEVMLVVSGVVALVGLVAWWFLIANTADPSGPLQPV